MKWQTIIMVMMLIETVAAMDSELFNPYMGDSELYNYLGGDGQLNIFFTSIIPGMITVGGNLYPYRNISIGFYDVKIRVLNEKVKMGSKVKAEITLKNTGDFPDADTQLYYFLSNENYTYKGTKEYLFEVPPINYNRDECNKAGGIIEKDTGNCITILKRDLFISTDVILGDWYFNVMYNTTIQDEIRVYDKFEVIESKDYLWLIPFGLIIALIFLGIKKIDRRD